MRATALGIIGIWFLGLAALKVVLFIANRKLMRLYSDSKISPPNSLPSPEDNPWDKFRAAATDPPQISQAKLLLRRETYSRAFAVFGVMVVLLILWFVVGGKPE
jgi:hypothetical protein